MAKRSGSRSSRSERRAGRDRAQRAKDHGLPERPAAPLRARAATPEPRSDGGQDRSSDAPRAPVATSSTVPSWVWVAGGALLLLVGAYVMSQKRDAASNEAKPEPETPVAPASTALESSEPSPEPSASAAAPEESAPAAPEPVASVSEPEKPRVVAPVIAKPRAPAVAKPAVPVVAPPAPVPVPAPATPSDSPY